jgi:hypothetical protein
MACNKYYDLSSDNDSIGESSSSSSDEGSLFAAAADDDDVKTTISTTDPLWGRTIVEY